LELAPSKQLEALAGGRQTLCLLLLWWCYTLQNLRDREELGKRCVCVSLPLSLCFDGAVLSKMWDAKRAWQRRVSLSALMVVLCEQNLRGARPWQMVSLSLSPCPSLCADGATLWAKSERGARRTWETVSLDGPNSVKSERCKSLRNTVPLCAFMVLNSEQNLRDERAWQTVIEREEKKKKAASALRSKVFKKRKCNTQEKKSSWREKAVRMIMAIRTTPVFVCCQLEEKHFNLGCDIFAKNHIRMNVPICKPSMEKMEKHSVWVPLSLSLSLSLSLMLQIFFTY
jgi:hypothetical protein